MTGLDWSSVSVVSYMGVFTKDDIDPPSIFKNGHGPHRRSTATAEF